MVKKLYNFYWDCGRSGSVEGLFIAEEEVIKSVIGENVSFGEILGKHSDVSGSLTEEDLSILDIPDDVVLLLEEKIGSTISGYNPLEFMYHYCSECEAEFSADEKDLNLEYVSNEKHQGYLCTDCKENQ